MLHVFQRALQRRRQGAPRSPHAAAGDRSTAPRRTRCTLVLVAKRRQGHTDDFHAIARSIERLAPDIRVSVVRDRPYNAWRPGVLLRPSLIVSPLALRKLKPLRGAVAQNRLLTKSQEYTALEQAHIPVPRWALVSEHHTPDLSAFGEYVVTKPDCGGRGAEVKIKRRGRVRWKPPANQRALRTGHREVIVQEFIYTGPWPVSYRVTTLFGRVLFAWKVTASQARRALAGPDRFRDGAEGGGMSIVSSGAGCRFELSDDPEILDLATRAHAALPDHPLLGFDILREEPSGRLVVIEANTCGQLWHFSSPTGLSVQHDNRIDFRSQFDGLHVAAQALIDETRRRAA